MTATGEPLFVLDGRAFRRPAVSTPRRDNYVLRAATDAGLVSASLDGDAETVVRRAMGSDALARAFAGVLEEDGVKWTPAWADAAAEAILDAEDVAVRAAYRAHAVERVLDFFVSAARLLGTSRTSSERPAAAPPEPLVGLIPADAIPPEPFEGSPPSISATGTTSSASSPTMTPAASSA